MKYLEELDKRMKAKALILEVGKKSATNNRTYSEELCQKIIDDIYKKWKAGYNVYLYSEKIPELDCWIGRLIEIEKDDKKIYGIFEIFVPTDFDYQKCYVGFHLNAEIKEGAVINIQEIAGFYISTKAVGFKGKLENIS